MMGLIRQVVHHRSRILFHGMQLLLFAILVAGVYTRQVSVVVNGGVALGITFLPAYLARNYDIVMRPGITLWISAAVLLHAAGTLGLYTMTAWWDSMTHALSASVVAGVGYATVQAIDQYDEDIHLPQRFMFLFILLFVMAFGVLWELLEFGISEATRLTGSPILTQYGIDDTATDVMFNLVGALLFALIGTTRVQHLIDSVHTTLERRGDHHNLHI